MRAVALQKFGEPDVLRAEVLPDPTPAAGRAIVRVSAATVNPTDTLLRSGQQAARMTQLPPPYIPGMEFSGHVESIGDGEATLEVGQPVMGIVNPRRREGGAQAELLSVPIASLMPVDASLDLVEAATIPMNGLTALKAVDAMDLGPGQTVLVTGGAGAVGAYVVQIAKHRGLIVIADAKPADEPLLLRMGADHVVPRGAGMTQAVRDLASGGVDGLVDAARIGVDARSLVRDGGIAIAVRVLQGDEEARMRHQAIGVTQHAEDVAALRELSELAASGVLTPRVARTLPMEQASEAHQLVEAGGLRGRVVLLFS